MTQIDWANDDSGNFDTAADWTGGVAPKFPNDAYLDVAGSAPYVVSVTSTGTVNSFQTAANATLSVDGAGVELSARGSCINAGTIAVAAGARFDGYHVTNGGAVIIGDGATFDATTELDMTNSGTVHLEGSGNPTALDAGTLTGSGGILLSDSATNLITIRDNFDNTISGAGQIGEDTGVRTESGGFTNDANGVIDGSGAHNPLVLTSGLESGVLNYGLIESTGAGGLLIDDAGVTQVDTASASNPTPGVILAAAGCVVSLESAKILGGSLTGSGLFEPTDTGSVLFGRPGDYYGESDVLTIGAHILIKNGMALAIDGPIVNSGVISLNGSGAATDLFIGAGDAALTTTLTGGGLITMSGSGDAIGGRSQNSLINVDNTISGAGSVGLAHTIITNEAAGVIDADANGGITLNTTGAVTTNDGLLEATGAGVLSINSTTVNDAVGGTILAGTGAHVLLNTATIEGGTLKSDGTGYIAANNKLSVLDGLTGAVTIVGVTRVNSDDTLTLEGTIDNTGTLFSPGAHTGSVTTELIIAAAGATLSGGLLSLNNSSLNVVIGATSSATITNGRKITGAGDIGDGTMALVNQASGVINGNDSLALIIDVGSNTILNAGEIAASAAGGVTIKSAVDNTGTLYAGAGDLTVEGAVTGAGTAIIGKSTLDFTAAFTQAVVFTPSSSGTLELADSQAYEGTITAFSTTGATALDLGDIPYVNGTTTATFVGTTTGGVLTVSEGGDVATIHLAGNYTNSTWTLSAAPSGGTMVVDPSTSAAAAGKFVAAMASLAAPASSGFTATPDDAAPAARVLSAPRAAAFA